MEIISRTHAKEQSLTHYYTGKPCKHGHDSERYVNDGKCVACIRERVNRRRINNPEKKKESDRLSHIKHRDERLKKASKYREENRDRINESRRGKYSDKHREWREANKDRVRTMKKDHYHRNIEKMRAEKRADYAKHKEKRGASNKVYRKKNRERINEYYRKRRENDNKFKMQTYMRNMVGRVLTRTYESKIVRTVELLGYTSDDLMTHIEKQFKDGMSWDNYGEWHIDHIVPVSTMINSGVTDPAIINSLDNLQPLWAFDNLSKGNRFIG